jgi:hypothetical protein
MTPAVADPWALLELAHWCEQRQATSPKGSASCHESPQTQRPPRRDPPPPPPPSWSNLPDPQREQLLRVLNRMLSDRLAADRVVVKGGDDESR